MTFSQTVAAFTAFGITIARVPAKFVLELQHQHDGRHGNDTANNDYFHAHQPPKASASR
jgi:hypothetical protein